MTTWRVEGVESRLDGFRLGPIDLELGPGRAVAVLGTSGAGKTTLLRTLAGFLPVRSGRILRDGVDITEWMPEERNLGYVPQGLGLFAHRTVEGNVRFPLEVRGRLDAATRTQELLERFRLTALRRRYPARLSGGEMQRVALARALAAEPELIVWDEPWQALDVLARYDLGLILHELRETYRVPSVIVTHDPGLAFAVADSFVVLHAGRVRTQCDAATLIRAPSDPFAARFVGFENVFDRATLEAGARAPLAAWLLERAGPEGVAFASPTLDPGASDSPTWTGTVRSVRPTPHGLTIEVVADDLLVTVRLPAPVVSTLPGLGAPLAFTLDPAAVLALGAGGARHARG